LALDEDRPGRDWLNNYCPGRPAAMAAHRAKIAAQRLNVADALHADTVTTKDAAPRGLNTTLFSNIRLCCLTLYLKNGIFIPLHFDSQNLPSLHFSSLSIFCLGCKTISRRAARRLIVLHPKHNLEGELKWQACSGTMPSKFSHSSGKGLIDLINLIMLNKFISSILLNYNIRTGVFT
jgi:hypothetical protein